jgi:endonuclease I
MKKSLRTFLILIICTSGIALVSAQPTGYYNGTENKQGQELKSALNDIISGHTVYSYFYSKEIFKLSDADPNNPANIIQIYTGKSWPNSDYGTGGDQLNREHVWAKSHGNFGDVQPMDGDVHNLKPSDASVNTDKSNLDYDMGGAQHPEATGCYYDNNSWEPRDADKGDVARIIFYMDTRYEGENGELDLTVVDEVDTYPSPEHGKLSTLLQWNLQDPPDAFERNRNNVIYSYQQNRNPFIDNPYFAELIWNNGTLPTVIIADIYQVPEIPQANEPITIHATITSSAGNITDATLSYGYSSGNWTESLDMEGSGSNLYAEIPGQPQGTTIYYQIEAQNPTSSLQTVVYNFYVPKTFTGTLTSIYDIQGQGDVSPFDDQVVSTTGIVTGNYGSNYFIQDGSGAWNGLFVYDAGRNPAIGDSLILTGTIDEYYEKTELKSITGYYFISRNHALPEPATITCAEAGEPYEGVLIKVNNATCTDPEYQANYYMWTVNDGTADLLVHNTAIFEYEPEEGEAYIVSGPLDYDFDEWKIQLRLGTDVQSGGDLTAPAVTSAEVITETVIKVQFSEDVDAASAESVANYQINNGITISQAALHSIIKSQVFLTTSPLIGGAYELTIQNVADPIGNVMPGPVVLPFTTTYGVAETGAQACLQVYPNPAHDRLNIDWNPDTGETVTINLFNITGQKVYSVRSRVNGRETLHIDTGNFGRGLYMLEIKGTERNARTKVMIN